MIASSILLKLALSSGVSVVSKILESEGGENALEKGLNALNSVTGGVATNFLHQYSDKIDFKGLGRFLGMEDGKDYESLNHDLEKLMIASVPNTYKYLRETYEERFETHKGEIAFLKELEKQAGARPNDNEDYKNISQNKKEWLKQNQNYAWMFAKEFIERSKYPIEDLHLDFIKEFIETHFEKAYEIAFNEGLKNPADEKPYKAFILKTLKGLSEQIAEGQEEILKRLEELKNNPKLYLHSGQVFLDEKWVKEDKKFKQEVIQFFVKFEKKLNEIKEGTDVIRRAVGEIKEKVAPAYPHTLTAAPPRIDLNKYVERGSFLEELHKELEAGNNALLLNGLGGVGKSTQAAMYVQRYGDKYDHIAWLTQTDTFENMLLGAKTLQDNLKLSLDGIDPSNLAATVFNALPKPKGKKLLLVLDNVDETIKTYYQYLPADYRIILTSREKIGLGFTEKYIGKLSFGEAKELIQRHLTKCSPSEVEIREFCELLDYHTLSIELLIKTLEESLELETLSQLSQYLKENKLDAEELQEKVFTSHSKEEVAVYAHLLQSFTLAKLTADEKWLLLQFAVLPPLEHDFGDLAEWLNKDKKRTGDELKGLYKKGWLDKAGPRFSMHRMVQVLMRYQVKPNEENTKELTETFTKKLSVDYTKDNPVDKVQWIEYGQFLFKAKESGILDEHLAVLTNNLALRLKDLGDYEGAKKLLEKALISDLENFGEKHPTTAVRYSNLALVLQDLGDFEGAKKLLEKVLISALENFGEKHPTTAVSYSNLALVLQDLGDYEGAKKLLEKALISAQENFGEKHPTTAVRYLNYAVLLDNLDNPCEGLNYCEKAYTIFLNTFGSQHPHTSNCLSGVTLLKEKCNEKPQN